MGQHQCPSLLLLCSAPVFKYMRKTEKFRLHLVKQRQIILYIFNVLIHTSEIDFTFALAVILRFILCSVLNRTHFYSMIRDVAFVFHQKTRHLLFLTSNVIRVSHFCVWFFSLEKYSLKRNSALIKKVTVLIISRNYIVSSKMLGCYIMSSIIRTVP